MTCPSAPGAPNHGKAAKAVPTRGSAVDPTRSAPTRTQAAKDATHAVHAVHAQAARVDAVDPTRSVPTHVVHTVHAQAARVVALVHAK